MTELDNKYSLLKDKSKHEYPTDMTRGHFALNGRKWDATYKRNKDKSDKNSKSDKDKKDKKDDSEKGPSLNQSFVQYANKGICCCCGQKHAFQDCPKKDTLPKLEWFITKTKVAQQYSQVAREIRSMVGESGGASAPTSSNLSVVSQESPSNLWMFNQFVLSTYTMTLEDMKNCMVLDSGFSTHLFCHQIGWQT